ncbi:MAG: hypothetical protein SV765_16765 [Pseudomonadota bacterium]|nr:hypothetical protein [Pseudomonadales bacterium]MDY6921853.1 hypothetical protein [Pseudomonadota bacterium]
MALNYRIADFIPYSDTVYLRLIERVNETFWPWIPLLILGQGTVLVLLWRRRTMLPGLLLALAWPLINLAFRQRWWQLELAGLHPDPTAVLSLAVALGGLPPIRAWVACLLPLAWCLWSAATLWSMGLPMACPLALSIVLALAGLSWKLGFHR